MDSLESKETTQDQKTMVCVENYRSVRDITFDELIALGSPLKREVYYKLRPLSSHRLINNDNKCFTRACYQFDIEKNSCSVHCIAPQCKREDPHHYRNYNNMFWCPVCCIHTTDYYCTDKCSCDGMFNGNNGNVCSVCTKDPHHHNPAKKGHKICTKCTKCHELNLYHCEKCKQCFPETHSYHCIAPLCQDCDPHHLWIYKNNTYCEDCKKCFPDAHCSRPECASDPHHGKEEREVCVQCKKCHKISEYSCLMNIFVTIDNRTVVMTFFTDYLAELIVDYMRDRTHVTKYCLQCDACVPYKKTSDNKFYWKHCTRLLCADNHHLKGLDVVFCNLCNTCHNAAYIFCPHCKKCVPFDKLQEHCFDCKEDSHHLIPRKCNCITHDDSKGDVYHKSTCNKIKVYCDFCLRCHSKKYQKCDLCKKCYPPEHSDHCTRPECTIDPHHETHDSHKSVDAVDSRLFRKKGCPNLDSSRDKTKANSEFKSSSTKSKNIECRYFAIGKCNYGVMCNFLHPVGTTFDIDYQIGNKRNYVNPDSFRSETKSHNIVCRHFMNGKCSYKEVTGETCKFAHSYRMMFVTDHNANLSFPQRSTFQKRSYPYTK